LILALLVLASIWGAYRGLQGASDYRSWSFGLTGSQDTDDLRAVKQLRERLVKQRESSREIGDQEARPEAPLSDVKLEKVELSSPNASTEQNTGGEEFKTPTVDATSEGELVIAYCSYKQEDRRYVSSS